jgi:hypothetical protein
VHSGIPNYSIPPYFEARASFPKDGSDPDKVDLIFFDLYVPRRPRDIM